MKNPVIKWLVIVVAIVAAVIILATIFGKNGSGKDYYKGMYEAMRDSLDVYRVKNITLLETSNKAKDSANATLKSDIAELQTQVDQLKQADIQNQKKHNAVNEKLKAIPDRIRSLAGNTDSIRRAFAN